MPTFTASERLNDPLCVTEDVICDLYKGSYLDNRQSDFVYRCLHLLFSMCSCYSLLRLNICPPEQNLQVNYLRGSKSATDCLKKSQFCELLNQEKLCETLANVMKLFPSQYKKYCAVCPDVFKYQCVSYSVTGKITCLVSSRSTVQLSAMHIITQLFLTV